jgi:hypothetical protein
MTHLGKYLLLSSHLLQECNEKVKGPKFMGEKKEGFVIFGNLQNRVMSLKSHGDGNKVARPSRP